MSERSADQLQGSIRIEGWRVQNMQQRTYAGRPSKLLRQLRQETGLVITEVARNADIASETTEYHRHMPDVRTTEHEVAADFVLGL